MYARNSLTPPRVATVVRGYWLLSIVVLVVLRPQKQAEASPVPPSSAPCRFIPAPVSSWQATKNFQDKSKSRAFLSAPAFPSAPASTTALAAACHFQGLHPYRAHRGPAVAASGGCSDSWEDSGSRSRSSGGGDGSCSGYSSVPVGYFSRRCGIERELRNRRVKDYLRRGKHHHPQRARHLELTATNWGRGGSLRVLPKPLLTRGVQGVRMGASSSSSSSSLLEDDGRDGYGAAKLGAVGSGGGGSDPEDPILGTDGNGSADGPRNKNEGLTGQILSIAIPALVALSVDPLMSAVDTAYVGRLTPDYPGGGEVGLGALALNTSIFSFSYYIFNFLATVPTPFVASARAGGDKVGAARLIGQLFTASLILGLTLMTMLELFGPELLHVMGATGANEDQALLFLRTRALSAPAVLMMSVGNGAFRGFLDTTTPLMIAVGANAVNFVLDPILIFGLGMGLQGAAIATVSAEWSGAIVFLYLLSKKDPAIRMRWLSLPRDQESWEEGGAVLTSSAAVFGRTVALQAALSTACAFAARAGPVSIAAHQVASQLYLLLAFAADSLAVAAQCLVADRIGSGMILAGREIASRLLVFSLVWGVAVLLFFQVFGGVLPRIFTSNEQVLAEIAPIILLVGLLQPLNSYVFVGDGILQGTKDFVYEALTMAFSATMLPTYIVVYGYLSGRETTLLDVWVALCAMQLSRSLTFTFRHYLDPRGPLAPPPEGGKAVAAATEKEGEVEEG